jgi:hypothetical protein
MRLKFVYTIFAFQDSVPQQAVFWARAIAQRHLILKTKAVQRKDGLFYFLPESEWTRSSTGFLRFRF